MCSTSKSRLLLCVQQVNLDYCYVFCLNFGIFEVYLSEGQIYERLKMDRNDLTGPTGRFVNSIFVLIQ